MPPKKEPDTLELVDTDNKLTLEDLRELKRLAEWSRTARWVVAAIIGTVSLLGIGPHIMDWIVKTSSNGG